MGHSNDIPQMQSDENRGVQRATYELLDDLGTSAYSGHLTDSQKTDGVHL